MNANCISFIGLGKLGLPLACCFAKNDVNVYGIDKNKELIDNLKNDNFMYYEPGLKEYYKNYKHNIILSTDYDDAIKNTDISIILVGTQVKDGYSSENVKGVLKDFCLTLKNNKKDYHLIILSSTVMPGECKKFIEHIEKETGLKFNKDFGFVYIPDFVRLGAVIKDFENPPLFLVGRNNNLSDALVSLELYEKIHSKPMTFKSSIVSIEEAEIAKMALNTFILCKISFVNHLSNLCELMEGNVNIDNVTNAISQNHLIESSFFKGGLSYGGTCLGRDNSAFDDYSSKMGLYPLHVTAARDINNFQDRQLYQKIDNYCKSEKINKVSIVGMSFKEDTSVIIESPSIKLANRLLENDYKISVYDQSEKCLEDVETIFGPNIIYCKSVEDCIRQSSLIVFMVNSQKYHFETKTRNFDKTIFDCWRMFHPRQIKLFGFKYLCLGKSKNCLS